MIEFCIENLISIVENGEGRQGVIEDEREDEGGHGVMNEAQKENITAKRKRESSYHQSI